MTPSPAATDPRPVYAGATAWVTDLLRGAAPESMADPTPCDDLDVAALGGHLLGTVHRAIAIAEGRDVLAVPAFGLPFDPDAYADATASATPVASISAAPSLICSGSLSTATSTLLMTSICGAANCSSAI